MQLAKRLIRGSFWNILSSIISRLFLVFISIFIARIIGKELFGVYGMIQTTVSLFGLFAGFGLGVTLIKYIAELRDINKEKIGRIIIMALIINIIFSFLISIVFFILAPTIAIHIFKNASFIFILRLCTFILFFSVMTGVITCIFIGFESFKIITLINLLYVLISVPITFFLVSSYKLLGTVYAQIIISIINIILLILFMKPVLINYKIKLILNKDILNELKLILKFSIPNFLSQLIIQPVLWFCSFLLSSIPNGFENLASFNVANQWRGLILFIPININNVMLPLLSNTYGLGNKAILEDVINLNIKTILSFTFPICLISIFISKYLAIIYGKNYIDAIISIKLLILATFIDVLTMAGKQILTSMSKMWSIFISNIIWSFTLLIISFAGINHYKTNGLSLAYLLAFIFQFCFVYFFVSKNINFRSIKFIDKFFIMLLILILEFFIVSQVYLFTKITSIILLFIGIYISWSILNINKNKIKSMLN